MSDFELNEEREAAMPTADGPIAPIIDEPLKNEDIIPSIIEENEEKPYTDTPEPSQNGEDVSLGASSFDDGSFAAYVQDEAPKENLRTQYFPGDTPEQKAPEVSIYEVPPKPPVSIALKIMGWIFFGITAFLMNMAFVLGIIGAVEGVNMIGAFVIMLTFPIACLVIGIIIKCRGQRMRACIVMGIVGTVVISLGMLLSLVGDDSSGSMWDDIGDEETLDAIALAEEISGIDLPTPNYSFYEEYPEYNYLGLEFYGRSVDELMADIEKSKAFRQGIPNTMIGMLPPAARDVDSSSYVMLYNVTQSNYNTLPTVSGEYDFVAIVCYESSGYVFFDVYEYTLDYRATYDSEI